MPGGWWDTVAVIRGDASPTGPDRRQQPRVVAMTEAAKQARVEIGMTPAQASARCAALVLLPPDPEREGEIAERLLAIAAHASADFEATAPGLVTIDLTAHPWAGRPERFQRLGHEWVSELADRELKLRVGFADNPDLAALAARIADPVRLLAGDPASLRSDLAPLPLDLVDPPPDFRAILALWGVSTLGDFAALPRDELAERLGPGAPELWDRARGRSRRLLRLFRPSREYAREADFEEEIATLEPLLFRIRDGLESLSTELGAAYLAVSTLRLTLRFPDGGDHAHLVRVPDPCRDVDRLFSLIHTRLETVPTGRPVVGFRLELGPARPAERPGQLFDTALRDPNRFAETLAQIEALVGSQHAGRPMPVDTHEPDRIVLLPFDPEETGSPPTRGASSPIPAPESGGPRRPAPGLAPVLPARQGLPLRRFRPPWPLQVTIRSDPATGSHPPLEILSGAHPGRILEWAGPWRVSGDWWEPGRLWSREEWDVRHEDGSLYRLACWREGSPGEVPIQDRWYLEGVYG